MKRNAYLVVIFLMIIWFVVSFVVLNIGTERIPFIIYWPQTELVISLFIGYIGIFSLLFSKIDEYGNEKRKKSSRNFYSLFSWCSFISLVLFFINLFKHPWFIEDNPKMYIIIPLGGIILFEVIKNLFQNKIKIL